MCPTCGSGKLSPCQDSVNLECMECGWTGGPEKTLKAAVKSEQGLCIESDIGLDVARRVAEDYMMRLYQGAAHEIGKAIIDAGLVGKRDTETMTRLLRAACSGAYHGTMDEIDLIEKEHKKVLS